MVPNRTGKSPAPQWEILQDHGATDSSEVEDGRYDVPPHRMAPKPALKRKEGDRPIQTNSAKRPRVEQSFGSARQPDKAGPSRTMGGGSAEGARAASAARATDSPDAAAELLQYAKSIPLASKPRRIMDLGRASISAPVAASSGSTSAAQPPPARARPTQPQSHTQLPLRPRPRLSQAVPNSMKSASHIPRPVDAEIIDISSGDEAAPPVQPIKKKKRLIMNNAFKKRLGKPESASAPVKVKRSSPPEVIEILDSEEEEEIRRKAASANASAGSSRNGSTSVSAGGPANPGSSSSATAIRNTRVAESSDASMASGTDRPAPPPRPRAPTNAKGKGRAVSSDADSDASMAYAPGSAPTSRPSSRTDALPPPSGLWPSTSVAIPAIAPVSTTAPVLLSPARVVANAPKIEPATPQRRSSVSSSAFLSRPVSTIVPPSAPASTSASASGSAATFTSNPGSPFAPKPTSISASAFVSAAASASTAAPQSPQYTPKKPILGSIRAGVGAGAGSQQHGQAGQSSQQSQHTQEGHQQPRQKQVQLAVKSTAFSRPPTSVPVPVMRKRGPTRVVVSDSESGSEEDSGSGSQPHPPLRSHNIRPSAGSRRSTSHSGSRSAQTMSEVELEPDTRGLSDALGLTQHREALVASHTDSDTSSKNKGKGKEQAKEIMRPPLPGRSSTHSRTASASSVVLRAATASGHATPSVSNANPVASTSSIIPSKAYSRTNTSTSKSALTSPKPPYAHKPSLTSKPPKERKAATPGDSDEALPAESEGLSSDAGYETVIRGSQFIVNKLAQLRKEKSAASLPVVSSPENVATPAKHPPRVVSPEEQDQKSVSPPPVSPTPPLQASSTSTPAEKSPLLAAVVPRPFPDEVRPQSAPSPVSVAASAGTSAIIPMAGPSTQARTEGHRVPNNHQRPMSTSSIPQHSYAATTTTATQQRALNASSSMKIRSPGNKPIWPPPPPSEGDSTPEAASPTDRGLVANPEVPNVSNDVHMITDDEEEAAHMSADEASESDGGGLFGANQSEEIEQSDGEELREIEQVQHEVAEMSQSLAAASLSGPASMEDLDEEIPDDRGEGPSRRITRSSSASSGLQEQMPVTPTSDENENALVETASNGYAVSSEDLAASGTSRPQGKTYGGFPVLTWKEYRKDLRNFTPECLYAADIPRALHDHINRLTPHTRLLPGMRAVYEAMIQENTAGDEPNAPPVRIENPVDEEPTPAWEFYYTNKIYHGAGVPPPDIQTLVNCGCRGPCNPKSSTCACVKRQRQAYGNEMKKNFAYDKAGNLAHPGYPIYECNDLCGCGDECMNRVVQHGRKVGVAIRKTPNKGWGIFATQRIASGQFIGIYSGELLTDHEAHERGIKYNKWGKTYLFDIDFHHLKDPDDKEWTNKFTVDAYHCGNFTRFLNHSCDPNSRLYPCYINEGNIQKPLLAIFSRRIIDADEEICFNYQGSYPGDDDDDNEDEDSQPMTAREAKDRDLIYEQCMCGARNCTGVMFK